MFKESITKEELIDMPLKWFEGEIVLVDSRKKLQLAIDELSGQPIIGFDTETKPSFKKGVINKVALLQLSTKNSAFLIPKSGLEKSSYRGIQCTVYTGIHFLGISAVFFVDFEPTRRN